VSVSKVCGVDKTCWIWYKHGMRKLFEPLLLKFTNPGWIKHPELCLIDTILEEHPEIIKIVAADICAGDAKSNMGRGDTPSVEQIVRCAIYKEMTGVTYDGLDDCIEDSNVCEKFVKFEKKKFSSKTLQKYISRIKADSLDALMVAINKWAIDAGYEDLQRITQDSTVIESNIHYPTNSSLVYDCIKECHRLLRDLKEQVEGLSYRDYRKGAKKLLFKINNTKSHDKRVELFKRQLINFTKCINQVSDIVKKKDTYGIKSPIAWAIFCEIERLIPVIKKVYSMAERHEIKGENVPVEDKVVSIYEGHTDIIAKGSREVQFGHKVNFTNGKSNLILGVDIVKGNPRDSTLYQRAVEKVIKDYGKVPKSSVTDGGFASKANQDYSKVAGIKNIVFNKIVGSLKNIVNSKNIESRLKKWRSAAEAIISNLKRGFNIRRCMWKGSPHFNQKVYWSVIAYNIRVTAAHCIPKLLEKALKDKAQKAAA